ncbi:uncharacterized protein cubi_01586 [Cryptosporidium ubiquitum]|uniref:Uncharacterized protein n=1 Tax=Cryptosporidium ubiquitum TaxID=857276 RepID=A0A1J4MHD7_9CRYT|nr:uncharacterized protein cubi_01586 [Cryptosporidium ubiquitum]OII72253.1 hypothetical protein cubi_01586 [Cryptosporidium ubiquitum]
MSALISTSFALLVKELFSNKSIDTFKDKILENIDIKSAYILNKSIKKKHVSKLFNGFMFFSFLLFSTGLGYYYYTKIYKKQAKDDSNNKTYIFGDIISKLSKKKN